MTSVDVVACIVRDVLQLHSSVLVRPDIVVPVLGALLDTSYLHLVTGSDVRRRAIRHLA